MQAQKYITIKDLPDSERPYEKCEKYGPSALSDSELLAMLIRTGTRGEKATDLADRLLCIDPLRPGLEGLMRAGAAEYMNVPGIGRVKALQISAVIELAGRISRIRFSRSSE